MPATATATKVTLTKRTRFATADPVNYSSRFTATPADESFKWHTLNIHAERTLARVRSNTPALEYSAVDVLLLVTLVRIVTSKVFAVLKV